jgi:hypothetical protein
MIAKLLLLPLFISILSCDGNGLPAASPLENPAAVPVQVVLGNEFGVSYECEQQEINDSLVWVSCDFTNNSQTRASVCVNVNYANGYEVVYNHRATCSGVLEPQQTIRNYAAFDKHDEERTALNKLCGHRLMNCKLNVVVLNKR